jgi:hypothetical protein
MEATTNSAAEQFLVVEEVAAMVWVGVAVCLPCTIIWPRPHIWPRRVTTEELIAAVAVEEEEEVEAAEEIQIAIICMCPLLVLQEARSWARDPR